MFAIAFDLDTHATKRVDPRSLHQAYADIRTLIAAYGFEWRQGSVYLCENEDLGNLIEAMNALKAVPWFPDAVRDIRAFRVEQWSDMTNTVKRR